ncbi:hypothetical protein F2P56_016208 [Juglans regia]|uniref:Nuclease associated modular domain-containing protein n=2 Tax=Juglans regia TaxID=51240 RepID=A0A833XHN7_JUGRE|nr:uncharacterized protein LOC109021417 isoform X2 [Juglans regia]KAF5466267.1 hypothetical protein F2P56_016208 [Juglans regia]
MSSHAYTGDCYSAACLQSRLCAIRAQTLIHGKFSSTPFTSANDKRLSYAWKSLRLPKELNVNVKHVEVQRSRLLINAVATLEPMAKCLVQNKNGQKGCDVTHFGIDSSLPTIELKYSSEDSKELDERERSRRLRISKANKGNTPWNKGRKHSAETLQRIRERTKLAMQDPKVRMKLRNLGHAQSTETRVKIAVGVRLGWQRRREKLTVQEGCCFEWQNLIAEAAKQGFVGEEELQWDSYKILDEQLKKEWLESVEQRKTMAGLKGSKRTTMSPEQRRKISEAISAKWANTDYRDRVCAGLAKHYGIPPNAERKPQRRSSSGIQTSRRSPIKKRDCATDNSSMGENKIQNQQLRLRRSSEPLYKDPLASSKLEMIKNIRAERAAAETKKTVAVERARLLIVKAEKAAKALEVAAMKSPIARASLMETRKLIAEAIQLIESVETGQNTSHEDRGYPSVASKGLIDQVEKDRSEKIEVLNQAGPREVIGAPMVQRKDEDFNFRKFALHDLLSSEDELFPTSFSGSGSSLFSFESLMKQSGSINRHDQPKLNQHSDYGRRPLPKGDKVESLKEETRSESVAVIKKWVRGRLIEVAKSRVLARETS